MTDEVQSNEAQKDLKKQPAATTSSPQAPDVQVAKTSGPEPPAQQSPAQVASAPQAAPTGASSPQAPTAGPPASEAGPSQPPVQAQIKPGEKGGRPRGGKGPGPRDSKGRDGPRKEAPGPAREGQAAQYRDGPRPASPASPMPFEIHPEIEKEIAAIDPLKITREQLTQLIIKRHEFAVRALLDRIKENNKFIEENQSELDEQKKKRDKLNATVAEIKDKRQSAQIDTKKFREELFSLLEKDTDIDKITRELNVLRQHMEDVDWKLQTTAITLERERELVEDIRQDMKQIHALSADIQNRQGISDKVRDISSKIDTGFASAQNFHEAMLELVTQAEGHHSRWVELRRDVSDRLRQNSWLEHRMKMHADNLNYWTGLQGGKK